MVKPIIVNEFLCTTQILLREPYTGPETQNRKMFYISIKYLYNFGYIKTLWVHTYFKNIVLFLTHILDYYEIFSLSSLRTSIGK